LLATGMKARAGASGYVSSLGNYSTAKAGINITGTNINMQYVAGAVHAVDAVVSPVQVFEMNLVTSGLKVTGGAPTVTLNASSQATNKKMVRISTSQFTAGDFNVQQMQDNGTTVVSTPLRIENGGNFTINGPFNNQSNYMTVDSDFAHQSGRYQHLTCHNSITASNTWTDVAYVSYSPSLTIQGTAQRDNNGGLGMASFLGTVFGGYGAVTVTTTTSSVNQMNGGAFGALEYRYLNGGAASGSYRLQVKLSIGSGTLHITTTLTGQAWGQISED